MLDLRRIASSSWLKVHDDAWFIKPSKLKASILTTITELAFIIRCACPRSEPGNDREPGLPLSSQKLAHGCKREIQPPPCRNQLLERRQRMFVVVMKLDDVPMRHGYFGKYLHDGVRALTCVIKAVVNPHHDPLFPQPQRHEQRHA